MLVYCKEENTVSWCLTMFNKYILKQVNIPNPLLHIIFGAVVANGSDTYYKHIFKIYTETKNIKLKRPAFKALWHTKDSELITQNIELLYQVNFRSNYIYYIGNILLENEVARKHVWKHIIELCGKMNFSNRDVIHL